MFQQLLESNAERQPRVGGSVVSMAGHVAAVLVLVIVTASTSASAPDAVIERPVYLAPSPPIVPVVQSSEAQHTAGTPSRSGEEHCGVTCVTMAPPAFVDITVGIPAIDLSRPLSADLLTRTGNPGMSAGSRSATGGSGDTGPWSELQVDRPVVLRPGMPTPVFPNALRAAGISGTVMAEFVVDTLGRIEAGSIQLLSSDHIEFGNAVRQVLPRLRFLPAEAQGRSVRQLVRLPFRFDLHEDEGNANTGLMGS